MLRLTCYMERFPMCTMDRVFERLEFPPLDAVTPPDGKAKARNVGASVNKSRDWDALDEELA